MAYVSQQARTFKQGWWGPLSALATVWFGIANVFAIKGHRGQINEVLTESGLVTRPAFSIRNDNLTMIGLAVGVIAWIGVASIALSESSTVATSQPESYVGTCWAETTSDMLQKVDCSDETATYQIYSVVQSSASCPDSYLDLEGKFGCLRRYN